MDAVLDRLEEAHKQADALRAAWEAPLDDDEAFLATAVKVCHFIDILAMIWAVVLVRLHRGGAPNRLLEKESALLLGLSRDVAPHLERIARDQHARVLPADVANPLKAQIQEAQSRLAIVIQRAESVHRHASRPPYITADPEQVKRLAQEADEKKEWLPLRDVVAKMREAGKKE
jgi:hypothetical protein